MDAECLDSGQAVHCKWTDIVYSFSLEYLANAEFVGSGGAVTDVLCLWPFLKILSKCLVYGQRSGSNWTMDCLISFLRKSVNP